MPVGGGHDAARKDPFTKTSPSPSPTFLDNSSKTSLISRVRRSLSTAASPQQQLQQFQGPIRRQMSSTLAGPRLTDAMLDAAEPHKGQQQQRDPSSSSFDALLKQQDHYHNVTTSSNKRPSPPVSPTKTPKSSSPISQQQDDDGVVFFKSKHPKSAVVSNQVSVMRAPAPAMYWSQPAVHGVIPKPVRAHTSIVVGDLMYVFGGSGSQGCTHSLYALEMDTFKWIKPRVSGGDRPPATRAHSTVAHHEKIYIFGGGDGSHYTNNLYVLDTVSMMWNKPDVLGPRPGPRRAHSSFVWRDSLYIFGGGDDSRALNDLHALKLDTMTWIPVDTKGDRPPPRGYHSGNLVMDKFIVFGGSDGRLCFDDVHILNLETSTWSRIDAHVTPGLSAPPKRLSHASLGIGSYIFITGGHNGTRYCSDLVLFNIATMTWETRKVYGQAPSSRGYHTAVLYDSRLFLYGGYNGKQFFNQVSVLDLSASAYLPQITNFTIDVP